MNTIWNKLYDKIYCIHFVEYTDRKKFIDQQLKRIGILDSGIFQYQYTYGSNLDKKFESHFKTLYQPDDNFNSSIFFGHYNALRNAYAKGYERILILEDDVKFSDNLNDIQKLLNETSRDNVVLYNNKSCYQVDREGMQRLIQHCQNKPIAFENYLQEDYLLGLKFTNKTNTLITTQKFEAKAKPKYSDVVKLSETQTYNLQNEIEPTEMNICFGVTYEHFDKLLPIIYSIKKYSKSKLNFYIILNTNYFSQIISIVKKTKDSRTNIELIDATPFLKLIDGRFNLSKTKICYTKLFIPYMFPDLDRMLYLDYDTIIAKEGLEYLYNIDFEDKYLAVCESVEANNQRAILCHQDWIQRQSQIFSFLTDHYFNSGVILYNIKKIKEDGLDKFMANFIQFEPPSSENNEELKQVWNILESSKMQPQPVNFQYCDQSVLNFIFRNNVKIVSPIFNNILYPMHNPINEKWLKEQWGFENEQDYMNKSIIYHFVFDKPWEVRVNDLNYHKCNKYKLQAVDFYKNIKIRMEKDL